MRRHLSKFVILTCLVINIFVLVGCNKKEYISLKDFLVILNNEVYQSSDYKQFLGWNILDENYEYVFEDNITNEIVAQILSKTLKLKNRECEILDIDKYEFKNDIKNVIYYEYMFLDNSGNFNGNDEVLKKDAEEYIAMIKNILNNPKLDNIFEQDGEDIYFESNSELDFEDVEIDINSDDVIQLNDIQVGFGNDIININQLFSFDYKEYKINLSAANSGIRCYVSKKAALGSRFFTSFEISNIKPKIKWDYSGGNVNEAFFKLDFKTYTSFGFNKKDYIYLYNNSSKKDVSSYFDGAVNKVMKNQEIIDDTLTIGTVKVPIPNTVGCYIVFNIKLYIYTGGNVNISFETVDTVGMHIENNNLRLINDHDAMFDLNVSASNKIMAGVTFGLEMLSKSIMDIGVKGGIRSFVNAKAYVEDESVVSDVEYDSLAEIGKDSPTIKVCADTNSHWVLEVFLNSEKTLLNYLNLNKSFNILDESNSKFFPKVRHIENFKFVDECTYKKSLGNDQIEIDKPNRIVLESYTMVIRNKGDLMLNIKQLPQGIEIKDLIFTSSKNDVITIDDKGMMSVGINGLSEISVVSKDGEHEAKCTVLVSIP